MHDPPAQYSDERVAARNGIVAEIARAQKIPINDLFTPMTGHPEWYSDNVHFNAQGIQVQASQVASAIEKLLAR
jgi:lysophospholipase L1-like esterase